MGVDAVITSGSFNGTLGIYYLHGAVIVVVWMVAVTPGTGMAVPSHTPLVCCTGLPCVFWDGRLTLLSPAAGSWLLSEKYQNCRVPHPDQIWNCSKAIFESVWDSDVVGTRASGRWRGCCASCGSRARRGPVPGGASDRGHSLLGSR